MSLRYVDPTQDYGPGPLPHWLDPISDPTTIDWATAQAQAWIPFEVRDGRPVNPCQKTRVQRGRGELGHWGEGKAADAVVTSTRQGERYLLMILRGHDAYGWAIPGGGLDAGETAAQAASRELAEEAGLAVPERAWQVGQPTYVPDPRASDEAWMVTTPCRVDLGEVDEFPAVVAGDDAARAEWIHAATYEELLDDLDERFLGRVFPAHEGLLQDLLKEAGGERSW